MSHVAAAWHSRLDPEWTHSPLCAPNHDGTPDELLCRTAGLKQVGAGGDHRVEAAAGCAREKGRVSAPEDRRGDQENQGDRSVEQGRCVCLV